MRDWNHCISPYRPSSQKETELIIAALSELFPCFSGPEGSTDDFRTRFVKRKLSMLGHDLGYKVYANRFSLIDLAAIGHGFRNTEWLYDLHWYTDAPKRPYSQDSMKLVMECEWGKNRAYTLRTEFPMDWTQEEKDAWNEALAEHTEVKYDFQKLLVTNAELRVMVFGVRGDAKVILEKLSESYFDPVVEEHKQLPMGARFLLVAYHFEGEGCKGFYWRELVRGD
jgi:hypothetical protein